jgi:hypothetical protein
MLVKRLISAQVRMRLSEDNNRAVAIMAHTLPRRPLLVTPPLDTEQTLL